MQSVSSQCSTYAKFIGLEFNELFYVISPFQESSPFRGPLTGGYCYDRVHLIIHIIFSGNICIYSLLSWVVYTNMFPWELYDPSKMICILYLSCSAGYICICSLRNVVIFSLGLRPRENITTFLRGTYTYIPCRA